MLRTITSMLLAVAAAQETCTLEQQTVITSTVTQALQTCDEKISSGMKPSTAIFNLDSHTSTISSLGDTVCNNLPCKRQLEAISVPNCVFQFETGHTATMTQVLTDVENHCETSAGSRQSLYISLFLPLTLIFSYQIQN